MSSLIKNSSQGLLCALRSVLVKIMLVLQTVLAFSDRLWDGCAALYGVHRAWQGNLIM